MATLTVDCLGCGDPVVFDEPAEGTWEPVLQGQAGFGAQQQVVGEQVTVRCPACGHRTVVDKESVA